jgi:hypothetical protein
LNKKPTNDSSERHNIGIGQRREEIGEISLKKIGSSSKIFMIILKQRRPDPDWSDRGTATWYLLDRN